MSRSCWLWRGPGAVAVRSVALGSIVGSTVGCVVSGGFCLVQSRPRSTRCCCWRRGFSSWLPSRRARWRRRCGGWTRRIPRCRCCGSVRWCWCLVAGIRVARMRWRSGHCSIVWAASGISRGRLMGGMVRGLSGRWSGFRALMGCGWMVLRVRSRSRRCGHRRRCSIRVRVRRAVGLRGFVGCSVSSVRTGSRRGGSMVGTGR